MTEPKKNNLDVIGKGWGAKAALKDAMETVPETAECLVIFRMEKDFTIGFRSANITNAEALWAMEELKFIILAREHGVTGD